MPPVELLTHLSSEFLSSLNFNVYLGFLSTHVFVCVIGWSSSLIAARAKYLLELARASEEAQT